MANQPAMQLGPNYKYCTACAHVLEVRSAFCGRCGAPQAPPPLPPPAAAGRGSSAATVVVIAVAAVFGGIVLLGILAAIAIPNFIRYQLRAKATAVGAEVVAIARAERDQHDARRPFVALDAIPSVPPGRAPAPFSADDRAAAEAVGWSAPAATLGRYSVAVAVDEDGDEAFSVCAETDLDGDGEVAATVLFHPGDTANGPLAPPEAPCSHAAVTPGRTLELEDGDPVDRPFTISPPNVF